MGYIIFIKTTVAIKHMKIQTLLPLTVILLITLSTFVSSQYCHRCQRQRHHNRGGRHSSRHWHHNRGGRHFPRHWRHNGGGQRFPGHWNNQAHHNNLSYNQELGSSFKRFPFNQNSMIENMFNTMSKMMSLHGFARPAFVREAPVIERKEKNEDKDLMEVFAAMAQIIPNNSN